MAHVKSLDYPESVVMRKQKRIILAFSLLCGFAPLSWTLKPMRRCAGRCTIARPKRSKRFSSEFNRESIKPEPKGPALEDLATSPTLSRNFS